VGAALDPAPPHPAGYWGADGGRPCRGFQSVVNGGGTAWSISSGSLFYAMMSYGQQMLL
jgi:hypothetical protein